MNRISTRRNGLGIALLASVLLLGGCSGDMDDLRQFVQAQRAKKPGSIEPLPQVKPYESFTYKDQDLRSPFVPNTEITQAPSGGGMGSGIHPDINRNKEFLEQFPLDSLRMVGTLTMNDQKYALVRDPNGAVHHVQLGNHLGQNYGRITSISDSEIKLTEIVPDGMGGWIERPAAISISDNK